jgi:hypothetical protein
MDKICIYALGIILLFLSAGCVKKKEDSQTGTPSARIEFDIRHLVDGKELQKNSLIYKNASGNPYMICGLKYFLSDITFYRDKGAAIPIHLWKDIFYIDEDIPSTKSILFYDLMPPGKYDSISFIFGIIAEKNQSFMFVNPPEVNMFWPEILGGGYHYLMLDGKWKDSTGDLQPFNFHLGIGQLYHGSEYNTDSIYAYVQNYFRVGFPEAIFELDDRETLICTLTMNVESWFTTPYNFDFNIWGGAIMQNQQAMQIARSNGQDVFAISFSE